LAGNDLLSDFERYGGFQFSIAQVPLSDTFLRSRGGRVGSEINGYAGASLTFLAGGQLVFTAGTTF